VNVTVSIGRNAARGEAVLDNAEWGDFIVKTRDAVASYGDVVQFGYVTGVWNGVQEESYTVTVVLSEWADHGLGFLRARLAYLARQYGQESIALTTAEPRFIQAASMEEWRAEARLAARSARWAAQMEEEAGRGLQG
jgi:hypothetical protein